MYCVFILLCFYYFYFTFYYHGPKGHWAFSFGPKVVQEVPTRPEAQTSLPSTAPAKQDPTTSTQQSRPNSFAQACFRPAVTRPMAAARPVGLPLSFPALGLPQTSYPCMAPAPRGSCTIRLARSPLHQLSPRPARLTTPAICTSRLPFGQPCQATLPHQLQWPLSAYPASSRHQQLPCRFPTHSRGLSKSHAPAADTPTAPVCAQRALVRSSMPSLLSSSL